ncbi:MAG: DUF4262 domain-containing protein [Pseudomonas sp.]|uniref:DUF4262 domain-containing protein n=1 Tax=Pseudomonas sp. TaxID=306 RepID=UPI0033917071
MSREFPEEYSDMIDKYGYMVMKVAPYPEIHNIHFAYSIGLWENFGHPEIVVFAFGDSLSHAIVHAISKFVSKGGRVEIDTPLHGIAPSPYIFKEVSKENFEEYLGFACLRYSSDFKCYQCFYPDRNGFFPWDSQYVDESDPQDGSQPSLEFPLLPSSEID